MGLFDKDMLKKVKDLAEEHGDKVEGTVDKVADALDDKTGGKYTDKIESGVDAAKGFLGGKDGDEQEPPSRLQP